MPAKNAMVEEIEREMARWGGVSHAWEYGKKHERLVFISDTGLSRFMTVSRGAKALHGYRRTKNVSAQVRRIMREIGAYEKKD